MKRVEDVTLEDLKASAGEENAEFMDEQVNSMLALVKEHESEQNYWFVKYYLAQSFGIYSMGAIAVHINGRIWIKPWEDESADMRERSLGMIKEMVNKDVWNLFKDREDLAFHLFGYGTHQAQTEMATFRMEEERSNPERADWIYTLLALKRNEDKDFDGGLNYTESVKEAEGMFEVLDQKEDYLLMILHISPYMKKLIENLNNPEEQMLKVIRNKEHCSILRWNERIVKFISRQ